VLLCTCSLVYIAVTFSSDKDSMASTLLSSRFSIQEWKRGDMENLKRHYTTLNKGFIAEIRCCEAIPVVEMSLGFEDVLKSRIFLVTILSEMGQDEDVLGFLLGCFTDHLSTRSSPCGSVSFPLLISRESLFQKLKSGAFLQMLELIQILHKKMDQDGPFTGAIIALGRLQLARKHDTRLK